MNRHDWRFNFLVTQQHLTQMEAFGDDGDRRIARQGQPTGVYGTAKLTQNTGLVVNVPAITVHDIVGRVIESTTPTTTDFGTADNVVGSTDPTAGNERWVVCAMKWAAVGAEPDTDPISGLPFNFVLNDGYEFHNFAGTEDTPGNAVPPTLTSEYVIIGGVLLTSGQATITDANLRTADGALIGTHEVMNRGLSHYVDGTNLPEPLKTAAAGKTLEKALVAFANSVGLQLGQLKERRSISLISDIDPNTSLLLPYKITDTTKVFSAKLRIRGQLLSPIHYTEMPLHAHTGTTAAESGHTHPIDHDHGSFTSAAESGHTHPIDHDHASQIFTSAVESGGHTHDIDHNHAAFTSGAGSPHTHTDTFSIPAGGTHNHNITVSELDVGGDITFSASDKLSVVADETGVSVTRYMVAYDDETSAFAEYQSRGGAGNQESFAMEFDSHNHSVTATILVNDGSHAHTINGAVQNESAHTHSIDVPALGTTASGPVSATHTHDITVDIDPFVGSSGASTGHTHSIDVPAFTGTSGASTGHTHGFTTANNGPAGSPYSLNTTAVKTYINDLQISIDGVDRTTLIQGILLVGTIGDGTIGNALNTTGYEIDLYAQPWGIGNGSHEIIFTLPAGGGKLIATVEVNE